MVVGGDDVSDNIQSDAKLSSLTRSCSNLQNYPITFYAATGAIVSGHPIICGGKSTGTSSHSECYHHSKVSNSWNFLTNMTTIRTLSASVPVNDKLWILGGYNSVNILATTEYVSLIGDASQPGLDLPSPRAGHCVVKLSNGQVILLGSHDRDGDAEQKSVFIFDPDAETFEQSLPSMTYKRIFAGCAVFNSPMHENREVVLAVGGLDFDATTEGPDYSPTSTAEVLDYSQPNAKWNESNYV
jgi:hypothetical protein